VIVFVFVFLFVFVLCSRFCLFFRLLLWLYFEFVVVDARACVCA